MARLFDVTPEERRPAAAAFLTLFGITAGHTLLETARDALFLAKLPAARLPFVYIGIAATGLLVARLVSRKDESKPGPRALATALLGSSAVTVGFYFASALRTTSYLYALYLWTGLFASWIVARFWMLLSSVFDIGQAKRLFSLVGSGSVLGAVVGATVARSVAGALPAQHLLVAASAAFVATALGPVRMLPSVVLVEARHPRALPHAGPATQHPHVRRILALVLCSTIAVTIVDYLFKSAVSARVPARELGTYFANVSIVLNAIALVVQVFGVGWLLRVTRVDVAVRIMPSLVLGAALFVFSGGGLLGAILLRGVDGALRHSLHRTTTELFYVPLPDATRTRAKPIIESVGQRGGQALASVVILGLVYLGAGERAVAAATAVMAAVWLFVAFGMRRHYLDLFRTTLAEGRVEVDGALPELDLSALEALIGALSSKKDTEVIGALDLLAAQSRGRLIPPLILYHPSRAVVLRALELLAREGRDDIVPLTERLLEHPDSDVRARALIARTAVAPDESFLRQRLEDPRPELRATAVACLVDRGLMGAEEATRALQKAAPDGASAVYVAFARAIGSDTSSPALSMLDSLSKLPAPEVRLEVAWAMGRTKNARFVPRLVSLLAEPLAGSAARNALVAIGAPGLAGLDQALASTSLPHELLAALPRAIGAFDPPLAAPLLTKHLARATDGMVRYRILRTLARLRALSPELPLERNVLVSCLEGTVKKAFVLLGWRLVLATGQVDLGREARASLELLMAILRDKETHAIGRILLLLALLNPKENFDRIKRGLASKDGRARASSRELIENLLDAGLRGSILALLDESPDTVRMDRALPTHRWQPVPYASVLADLGARDDELGLAATKVVARSAVAPHARADHGEARATEGAK